MTIQQALEFIRKALKDIYPEPENFNIAEFILQELTGLKKIELIIQKQLELNQEQINLLYSFHKQLINHTPVQYILNKAWFYGYPFYVNEHVLIPRPETEELVYHVLKDLDKRFPSIKTPVIIDIGTGSGCIAISIKKKRPESLVYAVDVSEKALEVAMKNAINLNAGIDFFQLDFLNEKKWDTLSKADYIVSNPPYVMKREAAAMNKNVLNYEPHLALFVPDDNALVFYDALARFGKTHLKQQGKLFVEINESKANETMKLFIDEGFTHVDLIEDLQQKPRIICAAFN